MKVESVKKFSFFFNLRIQYLCKVNQKDTDLKIDSEKCEWTIERLLSWIESKVDKDVQY